MRALAVRLRRPTRTLFGREVFSPTHRSPGKTDFIFFAPAGANSARLFRQAQGPVRADRPLFLFPLSAAALRCGRPSLGFCPRSSPSARLTTAQRFCHASPVPHARLPSASDKTHPGLHPPCAFVLAPVHPRGSRRLSAHLWYSNSRLYRHTTSPSWMPFSSSWRYTPASRNRRSNQFRLS